MNDELRKKLEKNPIKYAWYKVFTKRVYLPLITIQLVNAGNVTLDQLALMVIVSSVVQGILQLPAGYFADRYGNRASIILGAVISAPSPLFYAFMPDFIGGMIASILFFGGYAFQSGAIEAFMHGSLKALGKEASYAKVMGRAQSFGLLANVVLIAAVPATYAIDPRLPFIIGFVSLLAMVALTISFVHPPREESRTVRHPLKAARSVVTAGNVAIFVFAGFLTGVSNKAGEYRELLFQDIGIAVALFGFILAAVSIAGAVAGWYVHVLDKLRPVRFYLFDLLVLSICLAIFGISASPAVAIGSFIVFGAYGRIRMIVFQSKLLAGSDPKYKATLLSALGLFTLAGDIVAITLVTSSINSAGYLNGYLIYGGIVFLIGFILWLIVALGQRATLIKR